MSRASARYWVLFFLLMAVALGSLAHLFSSSITAGAVLDLEAAIPMELGSWSGTPLKVHEDTKKLLGAENVLLRTYRKGDRTVNLCVTFSGGNHRVTHPAEVCYVGQGWSINVNEEMLFEFSGSPPVKKEVSHLKISQGRKNLDVIVWYHLPTEDTASFVRQKFEVIFRNLFSDQRWSTMVRLSSEDDPANGIHALETMAAFGGDLLPWIAALSPEGE